MTLMRAFSTFSAASGLAINKAKSFMYFNGMRQQEITDILQVSSFQKGSLPFNYLGIPISSGALRHRDCLILAEKITQKIRGWGTRKLSYQGRLTLVRHVLTQVHAYWARLFLIPSSCLKIVDSICRNYLWEGSDSYSKAPLVSWAECCRPMKEGGLGIKSSREWNQASVAKYTWWLASKADHLWVKWVSHVYLKGVNWKEYSPASNTSWSWRKICSIKAKMQGEYIGDDWQSIGGTYSIGKGYSWLRGTAVKVDWFPFVWNRMCIPRHQFIAWIIMKGRLLTMDRIHRWDRSADVTCRLCANNDEDLKHLFFDCEYSQAVLKEIRTQLHYTIPLKDTIEWSIKVRHPAMAEKKLLQAIISGLLYEIWRARNQAARENSMPRPCQLVQLLLKDIRIRVTSMDIRSRKNQNMTNVVQNVI